MSALIHLYLIDESHYPTQLHGNDESKYQTLLQITHANAIRWQTIELNMRGFIPAIEAWDSVAGDAHLLPACSFNYYPNKVLPPDADISGSFGFFPAAMVADLFSVMEQNYEFDMASPAGAAIIAAVTQRAGELSLDAYELVRDRYFVTFRDAAEKNQAVVVLIEQ